MALAAPDTGPEQHFFEALEDGRFEIQKCGRCGAFGFYPRILCVRCGSTDLEWVAARGKGFVYSTTTVRTGAEPYNISLIDLEEGPRLMAAVIDCNPDDVRIGMPVTAVVRSRDGKPAVFFVPVHTKKKKKAL